MPEAWARLLMSSNISKQEQKSNPQAVLDVLNWYDASSKEPRITKYMTKITPTTNSGSSSISRISSSSPSSSTPTETEYTTHIYYNNNHCTVPTSSENDDDSLPIPPPPPPIANRPEKTKSIYTKPLDEFTYVTNNNCNPSKILSSNVITTSPIHDITTNLNYTNLNSTNVPSLTHSGVPNAPNTTPTSYHLDNNKNQANFDNTKRKQKICDEDILEKLRTIVSIGDPVKKYTKIEIIGQG